jgi:hypothetical protein
MLSAKGCIDALIEGGELDNFEDEVAIGEAVGVPLFRLVALDRAFPSIRPGDGTFVPSGAASGG